MCVCLRLRTSFSDIAFRRSFALHKLVRLINIFSRCSYRGQLTLFTYLYTQFLYSAGYLTEEIWVKYFGQE